ncbi:MAG: ATP-binding protein [Bacteroidetes bacterium]|nr:ATP-binding protein [Bacteroidota bacterium]
MAWDNLQVIRYIESELPTVSDRGIVLITGARQTGKTTLVQRKYPDLPYFNLDALEYRHQLTDVSTFTWSRDIGKAVIDEIQKAPALIEKIKYSYDAGTLSFTALTGSSQIMLLKNVRESLAGRVTIHELFPFLLSELTDPESLKRKPVLLEQILSGSGMDTLLKRIPASLFGKEATEMKEAVSWLCTWGGMPPLIHLREEKKKIVWLKNYAIAYLERDLADLARLTDLKPFKKFQQLTANRASQILSYSELSRDAGIGVETARRYLEYLTLSYQTFLLPVYSKNLTSQLIKAPKVYWFDNGILRHLSGMGFGVMNGHLFENFIASEMMKWNRTTGSNITMSYYRTRSGMEVDFCLETNKGLTGIEVKYRDSVSDVDFTNLKRLAEAAGDAWQGGIVLYNGDTIMQFGKNLWALPAYRVLT